MPTPLSEQHLIYDWNECHRAAVQVNSIELVDETLRDGLQSPSVTDPTIEQKIKLIHLMVELGIAGVDLGLPASSSRALADVISLGREIVDQKLPLRPYCAARTLKSDVRAILRASDKIGKPLEAALFIGSSPIRQYAENWTLDQLLHHTEETVTYAVKQGLPVMFVTEDTTRSHPDTLRQLYSTAIECGARRICIADTTGHASPHGTQQIIAFIRQIVAESGEAVKIDWHGHRDRGLAVACSIAAVEAGVDAVHGTGLGVGERCGNTPLELLLINFRLLGYIDNDLSQLNNYCQLIASACQLPVPVNTPVVGKDAFRTATGVHAAALIKAMEKGHHWLADRVYSAVPASWVGREQGIEIGPMSGTSNVIYWLRTHGYGAESKLVEQIFRVAKHYNHTLSDEEILAIVRSAQMWV
ncbi:MAG: 2-isopropylmalate synthase [Gemmatimonadetes bacterium]|nr:MAG: 2-isopropylmalate synthase [Gemmatimonadota bacterium]